MAIASEKNLLAYNFLKKVISDILKKLPIKIQINLKLDQ